MCCVCVCFPGLGSKDVTVSIGSECLCLDQYFREVFACRFKRTPEGTLKHVFWWFSFWFSLLGMALEGQEPPPHFQPKTTLSPLQGFSKESHADYTMTHFSPYPKPVSLLISPLVLPQMRFSKLYGTPSPQASPPKPRPNSPPPKLPGFSSPQAPQGLPSQAPPPSPMRCHGLLEGAVYDLRRLSAQPPARRCGGLVTLEARAREELEPGDAVIWLGV